MEDLKKETAQIEARLRHCSIEIEVIDAFLHGLKLDEDLLSDISTWLEDVERATNFLLGYMQRAFNDQDGFGLHKNNEDQHDPSDGPFLSQESEEPDGFCDCPECCGE